MSFQWAFHLALLVDSLLTGDYVPVWRDDVVAALTGFQADVAKARHHYREANESLPHYERFARLLAGSGSDTADVIRIRHSFLLSEIYPKLRITSRDPNRRFDTLEREVIWNRDRGQCQNPDCGRLGKRVSFREATIHHVIEHTNGGRTAITNGVLVCPDCHASRSDMQRLTEHFRRYLQRMYAEPASQGPVEIGVGARSENGVELAPAESESAENNALKSKERLRIVIDWGALDVDRETQTICENKSSASILKLLAALISTFGKPMEQQLLELPVLRFPGSRNPVTDFVNRAAEKPFTSLPVPGTDLYFCPHSSTPEKVSRLRKLFSRLTLPDGTGFPPASVEVFSDAEPPVPELLL
jgi:5-methylcytosine-specific restriction endonuclease McrA